MIMVSSFAMAVALVQPPAASPRAPSPPVVYPVPPRPSPPPPYTIRIAPPVPPPSPAPLPEPSPTARELGMRIVAGLSIIETEAHRMILTQLRWLGSGPTCDFEEPECKRVAEEIAAREAPRLVEQMRSSFAEILGAQFQRTMTVPQMEEASRFLGSEAGRALIRSFMAVDERTFAAVESPSAVLRRRTDLAAEFARRTQHLPRAAVPAPPMTYMPPPPPAPPSPPRQ